MRVSKAQALENRKRVVEIASVLFRERGYDGVSVIELMAAAGLTHGGFYNQFRSKSALMVEATACGFSRMRPSTDVSDFINFYLSRRHRDALGKGCAIAALSADAARQPDEVKSSFEGGIGQLVDRLSGMLPADSHVEGRAKAMSLVAQAVGAIVLSRACRADVALTDEILETCRTELLQQFSPEVE